MLKWPIMLALWMSITFKIMLVSEVNSVLPSPERTAGAYIILKPFPLY